MKFIYFDEMSEMTDEQLKFLRKRLKMPDDLEPRELRKRHGSPVFYALLETMGDIHDKKSHDYASNDNPYGNYHFAGKVSSLFAHSPEDAGFAGRIAEKVFRLANLERSSKTPSNESIEDTEVDIAVITLLWMADRRERRMKLGAKASLDMHSANPEQKKSTQHTVPEYKGLP